MHFEKHAEAYDRGRPPYPAALWEWLREHGLLRAEARVLDLGAGTGLATGPLLTAGASVVAVEPGAALADHLRRRWPAATVLIGDAETAPLPASAFDLAVVATAVHWFDLDVVLPRVHRALIPSGHLAVWRNAFGDPSVPRTPFRERVEAIVAQRDRPRPFSNEFDTENWATRLAATGHFIRTHIEHFRWSVDLDADQIHDLFTTFSDWNAAEVDQAATAVRDLGGRVVEHYVTPLIVLRAATTAQDEPVRAASQA